MTDKLIKIKEKTKKKLDKLKIHPRESYNEVIAEKLLGGTGLRGSPILYRKRDGTITGWEGYGLSKEKLIILVKDFEAIEKKIKPIFSSKDLEVQT